MARGKPASNARVAAVGVRAASSADRPRLSVVTALVGLDDQQALQTAGRMAAMLSRQSAENGVSTELFVVDWQPPRASADCRVLGAPYPEHPDFRVTVAAFREGENQRLPFVNSSSIYMRWAQNIGVRRASGRTIAVAHPTAIMSDALFRRCCNDPPEGELLAPPERRLGWDGGDGDFDEMAYRAPDRLRQLAWCLGEQVISPGNGHVDPEQALRHAAAMALSAHRRAAADRRPYPVICHRGSCGDHVDATAVVGGGMLIADHKLWRELRGLPEILAHDQGLARVFALQAASFGFEVRALPFRSYCWRLAVRPGGPMHETTDAYARIPFRLDFTPQDVACFSGIHVEALATTLRESLGTRRGFLVNGEDWGAARAEIPLARRETPRLGAPSASSEPVKPAAADLELV